MKKKIIKIIKIYSIILFVACANKTDFKQKFIEDNFLKIVDTIAYSRGAFITLPSDTVRYPELCLKLSNKIMYNDKVNEIVLAFFEKNYSLKKRFNDVLSKNENNEILLNSNFPKKIGKFHIFFNEEEKIKSIKYAGRIDIGNLKIYKNKAILILSESVGHFGKTYILLLIKEKNDWKVFKRELLWQT